MVISVLLDAASTGDEWQAPSLRQEVTCDPPNHALSWDGCWDKPTSDFFPAVTHSSIAASQEDCNDDRFFNFARAPGLV
jgi:hypothetical protein